MWENIILLKLGIRAWEKWYFIKTGNPFLREMIYSRIEVLKYKVNTLTYYELCWF